MAQLSLQTVWKKVREHPLTIFLFAARWAIALGAALFSLLYISYKEGADISGDLSSDFVAIQEDQTALLDQMVQLTSNLLDRGAAVDIDNELFETKSLAQSTLISLGQLRAPSQPIIDARLEYRDSLENLIGVTNRIQRDGAEGMAGDLHNSLQMAVNKAGKFRSAVENFQGGAWPQVKGSLF